VARAVTLTGLVEAFLLVALLFTGYALLAASWLAGPPGAGSPASGPRIRLRVSRVVWPAAAGEALVLTLLAALWFDSLGHGGWLLVFSLLGLLASGGDRWLRHRLLGTRARDELWPLAAGVLRYILAGLICAWRLP
jgi:hypothetical protein